jgi:hypothetical protein
MYAGQQAQLPVSVGGLLTDLSPNNIPPSNIIDCENAIISNGTIQKAPGYNSYIKRFRYNNVDYDHILDVDSDDPPNTPAKIVGIYDWWPNSGTQYLIVVTANGRVYRYEDPYTYIEVLPSDEKDSEGFTAPERLQILNRAFFIQCGREFIGAGGSDNPRKLLILTGGSQIQVLEDGSDKRRNIKKPAADWNGTTGKTSYPFAGIQFFGRVFVFGNDNLPHFVYASSNTVSGTEYGHEDFSITGTFNTALFNVYPGEGDRIIASFEYKNKLHVVKYPTGLYQLQQPDIGDPTTWYFAKLNDNIGSSSPFSVATVQDDVLMIQNTRMVQSMSATLKLGGIESANLYRALSIQNYILQRTSSLGIGDHQALWHEAGRAAYFVYRGINSLVNSYVVRFDFTEQEPKVTTYTHIKPNVLALRRNVSLVDEIMFGSNDGQVYILETNNRYVDNDVTKKYNGMFQTPHLDMGVPNNKNFDFVEIEYIPTGNTELKMDWFIEGRKQGTKTFKLGKGAQLDSIQLDHSRLQGRATRKSRLRIYGRGRSISLKFYNDDKSNFKIVGVTISFRVTGQADKGNSPEVT